MTSQIRNSRTGQIVVEELETASGFFSKLKGLLFTKELRKGCGIHLVPCSGIHMFGMAYPIDVIYLDKNRRVIKQIKNLKPNRFGPFLFKTHSVIEMPAGTLERLDIAENDRLEIVS